MRNYFEFENRAKINCGEDAARTLGYELALFGSKKPFVLCSIDVVRSGIADRALASLDGGRKGAAVCFDGVPSELDEEVVREMKAAFIKASCDSIVAIGGASVLDSAKALKAFLTKKCEDLRSIEGTSRAFSTSIPMIFLPTDLCFGAELNGAIFEGNLFVSSPDFVPNVLLIDREIAEKKPLRLLAEGAIYAFANAVEALVGAEEDDPAVMYAEKAIKLLFKHTEKAVERAGNKDAATGVALASALAGVAYGNVPFGAAHALSDALSGVCGISKPAAMTLVLTAALEKLDENAKNRVEKLLNSMDFTTKIQSQHENSIEDQTEEDEEQKQKKPVDSPLAAISLWIASLSEIAGVICKISKTEILRETFGDIATAAQGKRASVTGVRSFTKDEFIEMLNLAY